MDTEKYKYRIVTRRVDSLKKHPTAQRQGFVQSRLDYIIANLDLDAIGTLHAVEYPIDGESAVWIIDGWHRHEALMRHGLGEWEVEVYIHDDIKDDARAARRFLDLNYRAAVSSFDTFDKLYRAGDPAAVSITNFLDGLGYKVGSGHSRIRSPATLLRAYNLDGGASLKAAIKVGIDSWGHQHGIAETKLVEGLSRFLHKHNGSVDLASLKLKLAKYPGGPIALVGAARQERMMKQKAIVTAITDIIRDVYNKGRRSTAL